jgi:hypothetical protein
LAARFVRDEEAAGSNPATPTSSEGMRLAPVRPMAGGEQLSIRIRLAREDPVHDISAMHDHRPDLLAVDRLGRRRAAVADQARDPLDRDVRIRKQRDEAVPQLTRRPLVRIQPGEGFEARPLQLKN